VSPLETAMAARKVIVSADEIIDPEDVRKEPAKTTIPYYMVDAVVHAPFGAYPGGVQGLYEMDFEHFAEYNRLERGGKLEEYLDRYVRSVGSHVEMLEQRVGLARLNELRRRAVIREGYR
jgi:glutaconate CoA-transferase subunit A